MTEFEEAARRGLENVETIQRGLANARALLLEARMYLELSGASAGETAPGALRAIAAPYQGRITGLFEPCPFTAPLSRDPAAFLGNALEAVASAGYALDLCFPADLLEGPEEAIKAYSPDAWALRGSVEALAASLPPSSFVFGAERYAAADGRLLETLPPCAPEAAALAARRALEAGHGCLADLDADLVACYPRLSDRPLLILAALIERGATVAGAAMATKEIGEYVALAGGGATGRNIQKGVKPLLEAGLVRAVGVNQRARAYYATPAGRLAYQRSLAVFF